VAEKNTKLSISIGKLKLKNPVMVASGTFGYGQEYEDLLPLNKIGAIVTKSISLEPYEGNRPPRICETTAGMLNSIGLQNEGIDNFISTKLPILRKIPTATVVSIAGRRKEEFKELAKRLDKTDVDAIEVNISCPNVEHKHTKRLFSQDPKATAEIVRAVRRNTKKPIIVKLSPNVTDIVEIAEAAQRAQADALSLINTVIGMRVDIAAKRPYLANVTGGLSGPAIKPIALRMVWEVFNSVKIPIIGMGGIMNKEDAIEFFFCGACAVQVGTATFVNPTAPADIADGLKDYIKKNRLTGIKDIIGKLQI